MKHALTIAGALLIIFCTEQVARGMDHLANEQAMPSARAVAASPSDQQAVPPLRASIRIAGDAA